MRSLVEMAVRPLRCARNYHFGLPSLLSLSNMFRGYRMRAEFHQGRCLVGNLASLLGYPVEPISVAVVGSWGCKFYDKN